MGAPGGVFNGPTEVARIGVFSEQGLAEIEFANASSADDTLPVTADDRARPGGLKYLGHGHTRCARARDENLDVAEFPMRQFHRIERSSEHHHGSAMLVVVKYRDVQFFLQARFDLETAWRADVLEVDAAETRRYPFHRIDNLVDVLRPEANRVRVNVAEFLE